MLDPSDFNPDSLEELVRRELLNALNDDGIGDETKEALHRVIAWFSVPGEYLDGKYDEQ